MQGNIEPFSYTDIFNIDLASIGILVLIIGRLTQQI